ncbi:MAG: TIGR03862 family flavoprotein, partial [Verrucomicrobiota bacterium]
NANTVVTADSPSPCFDIIAGRKGLNLTNAEPRQPFLERYGASQAHLEESLREFSPEMLRDWVAGLGLTTFVSSGGKVFPEPMKGAPLLRRWLRRLESAGVEFRGRCLCRGIRRNGARWLVELDQGEPIETDAIVLALGGASWPQTGSDGGWRGWLDRLGIASSDFEAANVAWEVDWPEEIVADGAGLPLKNVSVSAAGSKSVRGELVITRSGIEGGPIYALGPDLRNAAEPVILLNLKPDLSLSEIRDRLGSIRRNFAREATRRLHLDEGAKRLLRFLPGLGPWRSAEQVAEAVRCCPIPLIRPRPLSEAISSAGGLSWSELGTDFELLKARNVFAVGEMLDWEAPTGGYLLQACFSTGTRAGQAVAAKLLDG